MLIINTLKTLVKIIVVFQIGFVSNQNIKSEWKDTDHLKTKLQMKRS